MYKCNKYKVNIDTYLKMSTRCILFSSGIDTVKIHFAVQLNDNRIEVHFWPTIPISNIKNVLSKNISILFIASNNEIKHVFIKTHFFQHTCNDNTHTWTIVNIIEHTVRLVNKKLILLEIDIFYLVCFIVNKTHIVN